MKHAKKSFWIQMHEFFYLNEKQQLLLVKDYEVTNYETEFQDVK